MILNYRNRISHGLKLVQYLLININQDLILLDTYLLSDKLFIKCVIIFNLDQRIENVIRKYEYCISTSSLFSSLHLKL